MTPAGIYVEQHVMSAAHRALQHEAEAESTARKRRHLQTAGLVLLVFIAYLPALGGGFIWDDNFYVTGSPVLRSWSGLWNIWVHPSTTLQYYPLVHTSFWIEYHLWELQAAGYHLINLLLHACVAVLLWHLLSALSVPGAFAAAMVFAVHPVHAESVAWITERKNVLSAIFYLAAAIEYFRFWPAQRLAEFDRTRMRHYYAALALYVCALLSKTVTCTLPVAVLLVAWWKRGRVNRREWMLMLPFLALGAALGLTTALMEKRLVGASGPQWDIPFLHRCIVAGHAVWFYAGKLFWPHPLIFFYPRWDVQHPGVLQYQWPLAVVGLVVALWLLRRNIGRGPVTAVLFFIVTLGPALGFVNVYPMQFSFVADHFQYLASIGPIVLASAVGTLLVSRKGINRSVGTTAGVIILIGFTGLTFRRTYILADAERLWLDTIDKNPNCWTAHNNYGRMLFRRGDLRDAKPHLQAALRLKPDCAEAYTNYGSVLAREGQFESAIAYFNKSLELDPKLAEAHMNLGNAYATKGDRTKSEEHYHAALSLEPNSAMAHYNYGYNLERWEDLSKARSEYNRALELDADFRAARQRLDDLNAR